MTTMAVSLEIRDTLCGMRQHRDESMDDLLRRVIIRIKELKELRELYELANDGLEKSWNKNTEYVNEIIKLKSHWADSCLFASFGSIYSNVYIY